MTVREQSEAPLRCIAPELKPLAAAKDTLSKKENIDLPVAKAYKKTSFDSVMQDMI